MCDYVTSSGRASLIEYWWLSLAPFLALVVPVFLMIGVAAATGTDPGDGAAAGFFGLWVIVVVLGGLVPTIAVNVRRLHDIGQSGWLCLLVFIPSLGGIALLVLCEIGRASCRDRGLVVVRSVCVAYEKMEKRRMGSA